MLFPEMMLDTPELDEEAVGRKLISHIYNIVHVEKKNYIGMMTGSPQVGKSWNGGTIGCLLDPQFYDELEKNVVYDAKQFMTRMYEIVKSRERGRFIMWDEAGVGIPSRQWYDISNRAISFAIQVAGVFGPFIFFNTQDLSYIDSQPRKLINGFFEVSRTNTRYSRIKAYEISVNRKVGKMYFKYPRLKTEAGCYFQLKGFIKLMKPPREFQKRYDEHSKPFKERITALSLKRADDFELGKLGYQDLTTGEIINKVTNECGKYLSPNSTSEKVRVHAGLIEHDFKIPSKLAAVIKLRVEQNIADKPKMDGYYEKA